MRLLLTVALLCAVTVSAGAEELSKEEKKIWDQAVKALDKPESLYLYSLDPEAKKAKENDEAFHGWVVLGKADVKEAAKEKAIVAVARESKPGFGAKCFDPRHGIRVTSGGVTVDFVVCFECHWSYVHVGDKHLKLTIDPRHQEALDKILTDAKVPLPKQAK